MKRLIKKAYLVAIDDVQIGDDVEVCDDPNYKDLDMNKLSLPQNRDGACAVDVKNNKFYLGTNGETHAQLLEKYYNIDQDSNEMRHETDSYVVFGVYLKDFLGQESIIMYSSLPGVAEIITREKPGCFVYEEELLEGYLTRIARRIK